MSEPLNTSDFESFHSNVIVSSCSSLDDVDNDSATNRLRSTKSDEKNTCDTRDLSLTDSDQSLLEIPKLLNASYPSSICSTKPLEWDSGADVGYAIISKQQSQEMSTIERIAVSSLVCNANSTPMDYKKIISMKKKSNSLINLNDINLPKGQRSASVETFKCIATKSDTFPKYRSPLASSLSVSTVVQKLETLNVEHIFEQEKRFRQLGNNSNIEQKSIESSKESTSTLESVDTTGSWVAKEFGDFTNTTTDRVNSFEYLPGNAYYNSRVDQNEDYSDKEIKQSTKFFVEAMKKNGLTNKLQRKEIFKEIIESFLTNYVQKEANNSTEKSTSDTDQTPIRQDFTSQTSNTGNTIVNNQKNNQSSTITFTSPITSSRYGDADSKYDESSMDSGRHIDLQKCKIKKVYTTCKLKNQGVQCSIEHSTTDVNNVDANLKQSASTKSNVSKKEGNLKSCTKHNDQKKTNYKDTNNEFEKQMVWFHKNYMKTERENQMLWINNQISHLNNLKKLLSTHEELKKNWNIYKQKKPTTHNKSKYRRCSHPISNSNSDLTTTTKSSSDITTTTKTDSTISSKQCSVRSRCIDTDDAESSNTVCDHVHYKKGIVVDEFKSIKKCCEKTLYVIKETQKQSPNKLKTTETQTESINETELTIDETTLKQNRQYSTQSVATYTVEHKLKPVSAKSSITYDIIFKPSTRCQKKIDDFDKNESKPQLKHSISVACQTNKIPFQPKLSLQEYLLKNRPDYVNRAEERQTILTDIANLRDERNKLKKDLLITHNNENKVPPNPLAVKRIMNQKEMRKQTERKYRKCPEVQNKKVEIKRKEEYKTNKIMVNIFNKKLQKKTLKGNVDLSNSISVCSA